MTRDTSGRIPAVAIELDVDYCTKTFGVTCSATLTDHKCKNTIGTCERVDEFDRGVKTVKFCQNTQDTPQGGEYLPLLASAKVVPAQINPGGGDRNTTALGTRATLNATFKDSKVADWMLDKYYAERLSGAAQADGVPYDPYERSTFWPKFFASHMYLLNRPIRHISGYYDEQGNIVDSVTRHFIITDMSGPNANGQVTISGQDILAKTKIGRGMAPVESTGKLSSFLSYGMTTATLEPAGIGDAEYPASGFARIGTEVVGFTRVGDVLTLDREQFGTQQVDAEQGDTVQLCLHLPSMRVDDIAYVLLHDYAGIPDENLDTVEWAAEAASFAPYGYTTLITDPTDVATLLAEICEQMHVYIFFDERTNLVKMRAVRPAQDDTIYDLYDDSDIKAGTLSITAQPDQVITRVAVNYGIKNYVEGLDEPSNYWVKDLVVALDEESERRTQSSKTKVIFSRWMTSSDGAAAIELGQKLLARYRVPPRKITFDLDAKNRDIWVGDFIRLHTYKNVNEVGTPVPLNAQIMSVTEKADGDTFSYVAQQFTFELPPSPDERAIYVGGDMLDINLRELYDARYPSDPPDNDTVVNLIVRQGVYVGASTTANAAIEVLDADWPIGTSIKITNYGFIYGKGGDSPDWDILPVSPVAPSGLPGGTALLVTRSIELNNTNVIAGGGGAGGHAGARYFGTGAGGGGAGFSVGTPLAQDPETLRPATPGTRTSGGLGGTEKGSALVGGNGGALGMPGQPGPNGELSNGGAGGAAGYAIDGESLIIMTNPGTIIGPTVN